MNYPELQVCLIPNEITYVCKETLPIVTYTPKEDCEATLIHPSTTSLPKGLCEQRILTLNQTYWIPLHMSNEWLYTSPKDEIFTVLCGNEKSQMKLQGCGKLHLPPRCKGYSTHSTLYAISTIVSNSSKDDVLPLAPVDLDCCLSIQEKEQLSEVSLNKPSTNILSSVEDLKIASVKVDEIQDMNKEEERKKFKHFSLSMTTWGSAMLTFVIFVVCMCCSCCCKCCRQIGFWIWDKWTPQECLRQTRERCCIVHNFTVDHINYKEVPPTSLQVETIDTPPGTPLSSCSLPVSLLAPSLSKLMKTETARRRPYKPIEDCEMMDMETKPRNKERKGER